ncbi:putative peptidoglycan lipid II flippase [Microbacteriaceae bacterium SG_E_30_P1]|uniref:Peptidoglycan lipid II flippase n=1 Tax=Antiquaquibacter oligotrophicus TaxID=2880260 RepID=A0ABT6KQW9_9MICO|nr:murein biosynthesis integral membrane protein MurJ [Antiquaquibacter oligotrophicus]MDH6182376.1 putative peptidoglycan lipid II flippase [Antiquaquibacter oligotrophicus]UDF14650.1 murein biosynthesis integral membrane protein MurJ [Antiquaquibacter oligotrophicus]
MTEAGRGGIGRASALLASGTIVSRILGFVNAIVLAGAIGYIGAAADGFTLATQIPNSIYALIAGGLLSAVLVPQVVRAATHEDGGQLFINRLVTLGVVVFLLVTIAATLSAPLLVSLYAQSGERGFSGAGMQLAIALAYWCLPQIFFYSLYSLLGQVLNARGIFGPFTWAPALNNVIAIAGIALFIVLFGPDPAHRDASVWTPTMIAVLGGTATLGIAAQALVLTLFWRRAGLRYRPNFRWRGVGLGRTGAAAAWVFGMILITQLAAIVETRVATLATGSASLGALKYAWLIFMLPHSIVTVSIATAYFTRMSGHARDGRIDEVRSDLSSALRVILLIMVFAAVALAAVSVPFAAVFGGDFEDVSALGLVIVAYLVGLIPFTVLFLLQRVYYSLDDTRTVFFLQVLQSALFVVGVLAVAAAPTSLIAIGIALVMSGANAIQTVVAWMLLRKRLGGLDGRRIILRGLQYLVAALVSGGIGALLVLALGGYTEGGFGSSSRLGGILTMAGAGAAMALVYLGILWVIRNPELRSLVQPIRSRFGRESQE